MVEQYVFGFVFYMVEQYVFGFVLYMVEQYVFGFVDLFLYCPDKNLHILSEILLTLALNINQSINQSNPFFRLIHVLAHVYIHIGKKLFTSFCHICDRYNNELVSDCLTTNKQ